MIIGLIGYKQVGKSTAAKYLEEKYGYKRINFKDELIKELKENFMPTLENFSFIFDCTVDELFEKKPQPFRDFMKDYGMYKRKDNPRYWVEKVENKIYAYCDLVDGKLVGNIVIDDTRFKNEAESVVKMGGILIRQVRDDIKNTDNHISETENESIVEDYVVVGERNKPEVIYPQLDDIVKKPF